MLSFSKVWPPKVVFSGGLSLTQMVDLLLGVDTDQDAADSNDDDAFASNLSASMAVSVTETADQQLLSMLSWLCSEPCGPLHA